MLKNKIIVRKIRNIVILIMAMIVMIGAYRNIGRSRAEDVIEIGVLIQDNYGYLDDEEIILEAKEIENDLYEMELPESVNTKKIEQIVKITLEDSETSQTEEPLQEEITVQEENTNIEDTTEVEENTTQSEDSNSLEIVENKIQLTKEQIENQKINIEVIYGIKILGQDENGELISTTLIEKTEEERAQIEITEETQVLYNKILKYEDKENAKLVEIKGFLPIDAKLQIQEVTQEQITEIFGNKKIDVAYDIKIIREVITQTPTDEANPTAPPEEIIETVEINPEDFGEACEVVIKDAKIQKDSNVYHVKEDNTYEDVNVKENTEENVSFDAHTFSIYAVGPEIEDEGIMSTAFLGADPQNSTTYSKSITVLITSASGTGRICRYAWSTSTRTPSSGWYEYGTPGYDFEVTKSSGTGKFYLHFQTDAELSSYGGPYYLDNTAPGAVTISPTSGWTNTPPKTFALSGGTDSHAGFSKYYWAYVDGSESGYLSDNGMEFYDTQNKQIKVCAIDKAGNWGAYSYAYVQIDPVDPTPGTLTMKYESSSGSAYTSGTWTNKSVYIAKNNGTDALSGHSSTTYTVVKDGTTLYSNITDAKTLTDQGKYTITVTTKDVAGNSATNTYYVNIDKTAPTGTLTASPTNKSGTTYYTNASSFTSYASDVVDTGGAGISLVKFFGWYGTSMVTHNKNVTGTWDSTNSRYHTTFNFSDLPNTTSGTTSQGEGRYSVHAHIQDKAWNTTVKTIAVIYDKTKPTISVSTTSCTWRNSALSTTITVTDPTTNASDGTVSGLSSSNSYQYYLSNSSTALNTGDWTGDTWTTYTSGTAISLNPGVSGTYYLFVKRVKDKAGNTSTTNGTATTVNSTTYQMFGPYQFDYTKPAITYTHQSLDIDTANKTYTMTFRGTDEHYVSGVLTLDNLTILMQNGQLDGSGNPIVYNLKEEPVTLSFSSEAYTGANGVTGYTYRLTISNLEQLEIKSGLTTADYSGVITVAVPANLLVDAAGNKNNQTTITTGVDIPGGLPTDEVPVDVVDPIWTKTSSSVDEANGTATLTVQGTDTYFDESALATDLIKVYVNGTEVTGVNITFDEGTALNETRVQFGANVTVQYGIQHTISFTGLPTDIEQLKIVIEEGTLVDQSGNENKTTEFILFNYLKWTGLETGPKSGFLGNSSIQRENIANVTFVSSTASANSTKWDASARGDNSILAWYETNANGTLRVYIGSNEQIYANRDSSYLFSYIGYGQNCTTTEVITNLNLLKTSHVTNMKALFAFTGYRAMTSLNLSSLQTGNVTNMREMFNGTGYKNMTTFTPPSTFDTSKVTDMSWMFANFGYTKLQYILLNINTSNVTDMSYMFANCGYTAMTNCVLGYGFDTSKVTDMSYMFAGCGADELESLNLGNLFDTSNVKDMNHMFNGTGYHCLTTLNIGQLFDTSNVTNMNSMFNRLGFGSLTSLDLGDSFYTTNVTDMTDMFAYCGTESMTSLDLGPAFTNIASANSGFLEDTGVSGSCVIYAPEAIYKSRTSFKLNSSDTTGTLSYTRGTINPKYKPEWTVTGTTVTNTATTQKIEIQLKGTINTANYTSNVTTTLEAEDITVFIDGTELTNIEKSLTVASPATGTSVAHTLTLTNFEEALRQTGKLYKEWSGNITLKIGGRGEDESTYSANVLVDVYGNQSMMETDEADGTWIDIDLKDATTSTKNTNGKLFADFVKPEVVYTYAETDINHDTKKLTVVFTIADKYYSSSSTGLTPEDLTIMVDGEIPGDTDRDGVLETGETLAISRTLTSTDITATIDGASKTIGKEYTLVIEDFEQDTEAADRKYLDFAGIVTVSIPARKISDESGNTNAAETITIGVDFSPEGLPSTAYTTPYLPTGFSHVAGTNLSNGLTIQDGVGNQYVWVEVPKSATVYDEIGTDLNLDSLTGTALTTALTNIETELQEYATNYRDASYNDTWYSEAQHGFESADDYNDLKYTMLKSVYENGGFYIGKYETGTATARNSSSDALTDAVIQANAYPYTFVTNKQAQEIASGMASGDYTSSLMFGIQWDLVMKYLETKGATQEELKGTTTGSTNWGNYAESTYNITNTSAKYYTDADGWNDGAYGEKASVAAVLLSTGADSQFSKQGIYDLAGNAFEWTLEHSSNTDMPSTIRSGHYADRGTSHPANSHVGASATGSSVYTGFRVALYENDMESVEETLPYIPTGYTQVAGTNLSNGFTIKDASGNEFVWIEVPRSTSVYPTAGLSITSFTSDEYTAIENDLKTYTSTYRNGTTNVDEWLSEATTGLTETAYNNQKKTMLKSIYLNGGFYIGKYETGTNTARASTDAALTTAVIKQNMYPYNNVTTAQAQGLADDFAPTGYTSSLMYGIQWDLVIKHLENKGLSSDQLGTFSYRWGNTFDNMFDVTNQNASYYDYSGWTQVNGTYTKLDLDTLLTTGAAEILKQYNIYDFSGNVAELSLEKTTSGEIVYRGNSFLNSNSFTIQKRDVVSGTDPLQLGFRVALYANEAQDTGSDETPIVDFVNPKWTIEAVSGGIKLRAIDEYFKQATLTPEDITVYVNGVENTVLTKDITSVAPVDIKDTVDGVANTVVGKEYTLKLPNLGAATGYTEFSVTSPLVGGTAKYRNDNAGEISIEIAAGTIEDTSGNLSEVAEKNVGNYDSTPLEVFKVQSINDTSAKTETIIFNVTDKNYDKTDLIGVDSNSDGIIDDINDELTIKIDGTEITDDINIQSLSYKEIKYDVDGNGTDEVVGHQYTLVLNEFVETDAEYIASARDYREWSGTVSIEIAQTAAKDLNGNNIEPSTTTVEGDYVDYIAPEVKYTHQSTDIDKTNKKYTMTFEVTDKYYASGVLTLNDLTILMQNGQLDGSGNPIVYNLKDEPVSLAFNATAKGTIGHTYTLTISDLEKFEIKTGLTTADYSGIITVAILADKIVDDANNKNVATTITTGVDIPGGTIPDDVEEIDVVDPIWTKVSGNYNLASSPTRATVTVNGTDTYFASGSLTSSNIKVYKSTIQEVNGVETLVDTEITDDVTIEVTSPGTALTETRKKYNSTETETVQYGIRYMVTISGFPTDAQRVRLEIAEGTLTDATGNTNKANYINIYNTLMATDTETLATSGFLGNTAIQRQNIESVTFVSSTASANATKWDVSAAQDNSILAWYTGTNPYQVYIGSNELIFANPNSSYLFAHIGYGANCTATQTISSLNLLNTDNVTNMQGMFWYTGYKAMTSLDLGTNFKTSNVTNMKEMFTGCGYTKMTSMNFGGNFDTTNVTDMSWMFAEFGYTKLTTLTLPTTFKTQNVTDMNHMFMNCGFSAMTSVSLGTNFNTSSVTDMSYMFNGFGHVVLGSLDLGDLFYTSNVADMTGMFDRCGEGALVTMDFGPAFTHIASQNTNFVTTRSFLVGAGAKIYVPEAIYGNRQAFKLNSTSTTMLSIVDTSRKITPKYKPEWTVTGTTVTNSGSTQKIDIDLTGAVNTDNYTSNVTSTLETGDITVWIDGTQLTDVGKSFSVYPNPATGTALYYQLTLTNFEESLRQAGKLYKEWSGNIALRIAGRGEATSTYTANVLKDSYGNQSMMATDEAGGTWINVELKDATTSTANTNGKLFADFIKPEFTYEYSETIIGDGNHGDTKILTVVFYVADKYFDATNSTGITLASFYNPSTDASSDGKPVFQVAGEAININVAGNSLTPEALPDGKGIKYTLVVKNLEERDAAGFSDGYTHSGIVSITIPANKFQDYSGNKNAAKTFTIGIDDPTTGDGHNTAVKVDLVDPIWELGTVDLDNGIIKLRAKDKYFSSVTIDEDDIFVYVNGHLDGDTNNNGVIDGTETSIIVKDITSTTPTDIKETVDGVPNTVVGKEYTLKLSNITPDSASDEEFDPTNIGELEPETGEFKYKYKSENGGAISIKIAAETALDASGNGNKLTPLNVGNIDATNPGIYEVRKTQNASGNTETIVFNVTDKNFDPSDLITKTEMALSIDNTNVAELLENATFGTPVEIKTDDIDGVERVVGHQYTMVISNIAETTKRTGKDYLEWSGTLKLTINAEAAKDITGNKTSVAEITDFIDYVKPQLEQVTVANPINTSDKTYTMSFKVLDKYLDTTDLIGIDTNSDGKIDNLNNELTIKVDGEVASDITWQLNYSPITAAMSKTVGGTVVSSTSYTIGHTYTLVLSQFEQGTKQTASGKDFFEWSGTVSIEIAGTAVKDTTGNNLASNPTIVAGQHVDFIKPRLEEVAPTATIIAEDAANKTETIVFNIMDKYLDTTNALATNEFTVYVDDEAVTVDYNNSSSTGLNGVFTKVQDFKYTVNSDTNHIVGQQYKLVLSGFDQLTRNAKEYKDYSGTVSIVLNANAVDDTSNNTLDSTNTTVTGDFVDYIKPDIEYTHQASDVSTSNKKYIMTFDITDKYYSSGVLTTEDIITNEKIEILMQNGQLDENEDPIVYNLKNENANGYVSLALSSTEIKKTFNKTTASGSVVNGEYTIGHTYTLTISNLEQLERKTGLKTADYSGIITVSIDGEMIKDTSNNGNSATTITAGVNFVGGVESGTPVEVDVVDPIWEKVSSSASAKVSTDAVNATAATGTSTITIQGTDTYLDATDSSNSYDDSKLTTDEIEVYVDGVKNTSIIPTITSETPLTETRRLYNSATTETVQYGVKYTMTVNGWAQGAKQVKIKILEDAIKDETGNGNKAKEFIIYNCLESAATETVATSGFLGGSIKRNEIQQVIFVNNLDSAPITVEANGTITLGTNCWDVSAVSDKSILAWTSQTSAPYTVYIGSDSEIFANQDASYLFAYIGFAGEDTDEDGTIEASETYYTATATDAISNIGALNVSSVTNMTYMFRYAGYTKMTTLNLGSNFNTSNVTNMDGMFRKTGYQSMTTLNLGSNFDTGNVTTMSAMFAGTGSTKMTGLALGDKFKTIKVTNMANMFNDCGYSVMTSLDIGDNFDTRAVTDMNHMFNGCGYTAMTSLDLSSGTTATNTTQFNTQNVKNMEGMFMNCGTKLMNSLNLGNNFDTGKVGTDTGAAGPGSMKNMFYYCGRYKLQTLDLGDKFNTSNVKDMEGMFYRTGQMEMIKLDLGPQFNTSQVTNMYRMFYYCGQTKLPSLDLGDLFYTTSATTTQEMFYNCGTLAMTVLDLGPAFTRIPSTNTDMFTNCGTSALVIYAPESIYSDRTGFKLNN